MQQKLVETIKKAALAYYNTSTPALTKSENTQPLAEPAEDAQKVAKKALEEILGQAKEAMKDNDFFAAEWHLTRHRDAQRGFISDVYWITDPQDKNKTNPSLSHRPTPG